MLGGGAAAATAHHLLKGPLVSRGKPPFPTDPLHFHRDEPLGPFSGRIGRDDLEPRIVSGAASFSPPPRSGAALAVRQRHVVAGAAARSHDPGLTHSDRRLRGDGGGGGGRSGGGHRERRETIRNNWSGESEAAQMCSSSPSCCFHVSEGSNTSGHGPERLQRIFQIPPSESGPQQVTRRRM